MNPEILAAKNRYTWLWLSPLLTIPTAIFLAISNPGYNLLCGQRWQACRGNPIFHPGVIAIVGSACWHLLFLFPALHNKSDFARWHRWQALILAGIRTFIAMLFVADAYWVFLLALIAVWFFGTLWGQRQAARGDCSLMRWAGHGAGLPLPIKTGRPALVLDLSPQRSKKPDYYKIYHFGLHLHEQGKLDEAAQVLCELLASDATPELKAKVTDHLKQIGDKDENLKADALVAIFRFSPDPEQRRLALTRLKFLGLVEPL